MKLYRFGEVPAEELLIRTVEKSGVSDTVRAIIADVEARGDEALFEYTRRFDSPSVTALEVTREEIDAAVDRIDREFLTLDILGKEILGAVIV